MMNSFLPLWGAKFSNIPNITLTPRVISVSMSWLWTEFKTLHPFNCPDSHLADMNQQTLHRCSRAETKEHRKAWLLDNLHPFYTWRNVLTDPRIKSWTRKDCTTRSGREQSKSKQSVKIVAPFPFSYWWHLVGVLLALWMFQKEKNVDQVQPRKGQAQFLLTSKSDTKSCPEAPPGPQEGKSYKILRTCKYVTCKYGLSWTWWWISDKISHVSLLAMVQ